MKSESLVIADQHAAVNTFPGLAHTTRQTQPEEGGDDVKSSWPLWAGLHTYYNGWYKGSPTREGEPIPKNQS